MFEMTCAYHTCRKNDKEKSADSTKRGGIIFWAKTINCGDISIISLGRVKIARQ